MLELLVPTPRGHARTPKANPRSELTEPGTSTAHQKTCSASSEASAEEPSPGDQTTTDNTSQHYHLPTASQSDAQESALREATPTSQSPLKRTPTVSTTYTWQASRANHRFSTSTSAQAQMRAHHGRSIQQAPASPGTTGNG